MWRFLPRSALTFDGRFGIINYPDPLNKTNSHPMRARVGFNGLITNSFALLVMGAGRARSKVVAAIVALIGLLFLGGFTYFVFVFAKKLPASAGAPRVGSPAPDFTLNDSAGQRFSLASSAAAAPKGVLLIFYRGYW